MHAKAVILATGGCSQIYKHNTNPPGATGDGIALATALGATYRDMEFVQFHPTTLYTGDQKPISLFLISEATRGEGALLRTLDGHRFMQDKHPLAELAPRDVVSREIFYEMSKTKTPHVYLDFSNCKHDISKRFPNIYQRCLSANIDLLKDWAPVCPAAHYMIGGIVTNDWAETSIPGLYAAGEVASTGVHGANRLASNSLLEGLVFGTRAAEHILKTLPETLAHSTIPQPSTQQDSHSHGMHIKQSLRHLMWEHVGIVRSQEGLETALKKCQTFKSSLPINSTSPELFEIHAMITTSELIIQSALSRKSSCGAHFRSDSKN